VRSVLFRFPDVQAFERLVGSSRAGDLELAPAATDPLEDGEWVLAVFEVGPYRRAASTAARASAGPEGVRILVEPRDCRKLAEFACTEAARPAAAGPADVAAAEPDAPSTERSASAPPPGLDEGAKARPTVPPRSTLPSGAGARVMVVDDDDAIRDMVAAMLEAVGLIVTVAASAEEALEHLREGAFELIVIDWSMPRMTGLELCRALRQRPGLAALPILFLTANTSSSDMVEAFAAGADDYVVKPFRAPELGARIFSLLRRGRLSSAASQA
jgi:two-component system phosphate regulon response regulator PhoB